MIRIFSMSSGSIRYSFDSDSNSIQNLARGSGGFEKHADGTPSGFNVRTKTFGVTPIHIFFFVELDETFVSVLALVEGGEYVRF